MADKGLPPALGSPDPYLETNALAGKTLLQKINVGEASPLSPAMMAVLLLSILYYVLSLLRLYLNKPDSMRSRHAKTSQALILMLAFLVLIVRIRLRVDLEGSEPPMYITTTYSWIVVLSYVQSFAGDLLFCTDSKFFRTLNSFVRILSTLCLYICVIVLFFILINQGKSMYVSTS